MLEQIINNLILQGGLGIVAAIIIWLYFQERKDRKQAEAEIKELQMRFTQHFKDDIDDKIADREALNQAISFVKEASKKNV